MNFQGALLRQWQDSRLPKMIAKNLVKWEISQILVMDFFPPRGFKNTSDSTLTWAEHMKCTFSLDIAFIRESFPFALFLDSTSIAQMTKLDLIIIF